MQIRHGLQLALRLDRWNIGHGRRACRLGHRWVLVGLLVGVLGRLGFVAGLVLPSWPSMATVSERSVNPDETSVGEVNRFSGMQVQPGEISKENKNSKGSELPLSVDSPDQKSTEIDSSDRGKDAANDSIARDLEQRAQHIEALIAGKCDPQIEAKKLFQVDVYYLMRPDPVSETAKDSKEPKPGKQALEQSKFEFLERLHSALGRSEPALVPGEVEGRPSSGHDSLDSLAKKSSKRSASRKQGDSDSVPSDSPDQVSEVPAKVPDLRTATLAFQRAYFEFFSLPIAQQQELFLRHEQRRTLAQQQSRGDSELRSRTHEVNVAAKNLEDFLQGKLDHEIDPRSAVSLLPLHSGEWLRSVSRLAKVLEIAKSAESQPRSNPVDGLKQQRSTSSIGTEVKTEASTEPSTEPNTALPLPKSDPGTPEGPAVVDSEVLGSKSSEESSNETSSSETQSDDLLLRLGEAENRLDRARVAYMRLTPPEREALWLRHEQFRLDAEKTAEVAALSEDPEESKTQELLQGAEKAADEASRARKVALEAAKQARSEAIRVVAEERARLLGMTEQQERYAMLLQHQRSQWKQQHELTLEWHRKVAELIDHGEKNRDIRSADHFYFNLRSTLEDTRELMRQSLAVLRDLGMNVPRAGHSELSEVLGDVDREDLNGLRAKIESRAEELEKQEESIAWEITEGLRDDIVVLNRDRLTLLEFGSAHLRNRVTGLSQEGIVQVGNEVEQIVLEINFRARSFGRVVDRIFDNVLKAPIPFIFALIKLGLLIGVFRWWRARADRLLRLARTYFARSRRSTRVNQVMELTLWYLGRIRKPLEWLIFCWVIASYGGQENTVEWEILWIVVLWTLGGSATVLFVDALAARETIVSGSDRDSARLRIESLRLVNVMVVAVGLILGLTAELVGRGAIYAWVWQTCWLLIIPTILRLIHRWRETIFSRVATEAAKDPVYEWVRGHQNGWISFVAACVGGAYMFGTGFGRWLVRQLSGFDATRRFLAYLFRREVAQQAKVRAKDDRYRPIDLSSCSSLAPDHDFSDWIEEIAVEELERVRAVVMSSMMTLSAVVGERGRGKSAFLRRLAASIDSEKRTCVIRCPPRGWDGLMDAFQQQFGVGTHDKLTFAQIAKSRNVSLICVDDTQHLMRQSVGGLSELDRFIEFAQLFSPEISWVFALDSVSWNYVKRARGDKVFFDQVIQLPRWSEDEIRQLVQTRTKACGIVPSFDDLVVPRQISNSQSGGGERASVERTARGYYRIVWDHANGNAAVALHVWRDSLFRRDDQSGVIVRLFSQPSAEEIESLGLSMLFVLRAIVQVDFATVTDIVACTQLSARDVTDAVRFSLSRGYLDVVEDRFRISWDWYRTITVVLSRQHLLVA